jgi:hypothetical protein
MLPVHLNAAGYGQKGTSFQMITPGTFLIQKGAILPESVQLKGDPITNSWSTVGSGAELRRFKAELSAAGWHYFYMGAIKQTVFGGDRAKCILNALNGLATKMHRERCNSMQIDDIAAHSFLGIPYTSVSAHCCHIQTGIRFAGTTG